ncbi:hypothetical protein M413DRAFT_443293 [Hebeloma cylindrosporum]|uniref:Ubiquitin-like domain-containing protein n=1 Tax=Hebeloma cylindrosporum TaxID=76867 RepID=A0A0C2Y354_HEBCY|nr:hypothetical protein M413DRAFT_443293 [Hebeloma cylindrosporum h7]
MSDEPNPKIQLKITFEGQSMNFSTKREKPLVKVFNAFSERLNMDNNALRFLLNEVRLRPEQTPAELDMEDGDEIDALLMQQGGGLSSSPLISVSQL